MFTLVWHWEMNQTIVFYYVRPIPRPSLGSGSVQCERTIRTVPFLSRASTSFTPLGRWKLLLVALEINGGMLTKLLASLFCLKWSVQMWVWTFLNLKGNGRNIGTPIPKSSTLVPRSPNPSHKNLKLHQMFHKIFSISDKCYLQYRQSKIHIRVYVCSVNLKELKCGDMRCSIRRL